MSTVNFSRLRNSPLSREIEKQLPANIDAERAILGAVLLDNSAFLKARGIVTAGDFNFQHHKIIFAAITVMADSGAPIDLVTLTEHLDAAGNLAAAGGAPYVAGLGDGLSRAVNVPYYCNIIRDKSKFRELIHLTENVQQAALAGNSQLEELTAQLDSFSKSAIKATDNPAVVVGFQSLLTRTCAPVEYAIEPLLSNRGTGEIYGWRGSGKSYIATQMAFDIAKGRPTLFGGHRGGGGNWPVSRKFRSLYVYGEMDDTEIQARAQNCAKMREMEIPTDEELGTLCMDYQKGWRPKICTAKDRKIIEDRVFGYGYEGLWLDNISTLWPSSAENQTDRSAVLSDWFADLNQRGIWVVFLHHAGKSGAQRGDSEKEDMLSFVIKLSKPANYKPEEMLRVEVHIEKNRHKCQQSRWLMPFELQLGRDSNGDSAWITRAAKDAQMQAAFGMFADSMPPMFIAQEVGVSKATIYRYKKLFEENRDVHHWTDREN